MITINYNTKTNTITINTGLKVENGGVGSGNWGHDGRPGEVGGSRTEPHLESEKKGKGYFTSSISNFGTRYDNLKGKEAINKLLQEKDGWCPQAFYRSDIGNIALIWGNDRVGLKHIIKRRIEKDNIDINLFLEEITDIVEKGKIGIDERGNMIVIDHKDKRAIIDLTMDKKNNKIRFLLTAYEIYKKE